MFSSLISAAAFILGASQAFAAPAPQATEQPDSGGNCLTTFGPFALTAKRISTGDTYTVRLLTDQVTAITTTSHMIVDTKAVCDYQPVYSAALDSHSLNRIAKTAASFPLIGC